jgi:hypothetical protein
VKGLAATPEFSKITQIFITAKNYKCMMYYEIHQVKEVILPIKLRSKLLRSSVNSSGYEALLEIFGSAAFLVLIFVICATVFVKKLQKTGN